MWKYIPPRFQHPLQRDLHPSIQTLPHLLQVVLPRRKEVLQLPLEGAQRNFNMLKPCMTIQHKPMQSLAWPKVIGSFSSPEIPGMDGPKSRKVESPKVFQQIISRRYKSEVFGAWRCRISCLHFWRCHSASVSMRPDDLEVLQWNILPSDIFCMPYSFLCYQSHSSPSSFAILSRYLWSS